ncbi:hypothetical protein GGS20DRAFT_529787 [Poronia punctata]|nr:hypothetical protein GGS20DRAFT_529787 [Poronia punctata]
MASDPTAPASGATEVDKFALQLLSPSVGVPQPLLFSELPVSTTVGQLKERIRETIDRKPPNDAQRLIHRGRLLVRDNETMLELFGEEALRSAQRQTLHLVLRDFQTSHQGSTPTPPTSTQHANANAQPPPSTLFPGLGGQSRIRVAIAGPPHPPVSGVPTQPGQAGPTLAQLPPGWAPQHNWPNHFQTAGGVGAGAATNQPFQTPGFAHLAGHQGSHNPAISPFAIPGNPGSPFQPEATRVIMREGVGPDGQRWRVTVNESVISTTQRLGRLRPPYSPASPPLRAVSQPRSVSSTRSTGGHDAGSASRVIADAMRRNASSSSLANLASHHAQQPIHPGVTSPLIQSRTGSTAGTPDPFRASGYSTNADTSAGAHANQPSASPEVYILSSPSGPQAILINNDLNVYHTPQLQSLSPMGLPLPPLSRAITPRAFSTAQYGVPPQIVHRSTARGGVPNTNTTRIATPQGPQAQVQRQQELQFPHQGRHQFGHGMDNPQVQAIRIAQVWPHIWMLFRLALFIWWFTSPTSSWSRWITVVSIAIALFVANTGLLNPLAEQIWIPLRRHLQNLIPLAAEPNRRRGADGNDQNPERRGRPDPNEAAARLVQQRRQDNAEWLLHQVRRIERAAILFVASLAPGLAERHIAQVEAEARAERQRQEEAEAAAAAAAAGDAATPEDNNNNDTSSGANATTSSATPHSDEAEAGPSGNETNPAINTGDQEGPAVTV